MKRLLLLIYCITFSYNICSQNLLSTESEKPINLKKGNQYLIIIACDKYRNKLSLQNRVDTAVKFKNEIMSKYYIDKVFELFDYDATKENIDNLFKKLKYEVKRNDSVLIYYSGRNYFDNETSKGYWIQYDGKIEENGDIGYLSHDLIVKYIKEIKALHISVISDSGFSKDILIPDKTDIDKEGETIEQRYSKKSRYILASDDIEITKEKSNFTDTIISIIKKNKETHLEINQIYSKLSNSFNTFPILFGQLKDSDYQNGSGFIFFLREKPLSMKELNNEVIEDKKITDKTKIVKKPDTTIKHLNKLNKAGIVMLPVSAAFIISGASCIIYDVIVWWPGLNFNKFFGDTYNQYVNTYIIHISTFVTGVTCASLGLIFAIVSIPLIANKKHNIKVSLNYNMDNKISLDFKIRLKSNIN